MKFFQITVLVVFVAAGLGALASDEKGKYTTLFGVSGMLYLASLIVSTVV